MLRLRLTWDIEYDEHGTSTETLADFLRAITEDASGGGLITGDTPAEVVRQSYVIDAILPCFKG